MILQMLDMEIFRMILGCIYVENMQEFYNTRCAYELKIHTITSVIYVSENLNMQGIVTTLPL